MPLPAEGPPVEQLRLAVRRRIAESSFRAVASEVGMSPSGLHSFLGGTSPHYSTLRKVTSWYVREAQRAPEERKVETLRAALGLLVGHLPEPIRGGAIEDILEVLQQAAERSGTSVPTWFGQLS